MGGTTDPISFSLLFSLPGEIWLQRDEEARPRSHSQHTARNQLQDKVPDIPPQCFPLLRETGSVSRDKVHKRARDSQSEEQCFIRVTTQRKSQGKVQVGLNMDVTTTSETRPSVHSLYSQVFDLQPALKEPGEVFHWKDKLFRMCFKKIHWKCCGKLENKVRNQWLDITSKVTSNHPTIPSFSQ